MPCDLGVTVRKKQVAFSDGPADGVLSKLSWGAGKGWEALLGCGSGTVSPWLAATDSGVPLLNSGLGVRGSAWQFPIFLVISLKLVAELTFLKMRHLYITLSLC